MPCFGDMLSPHVGTHCPVAWWGNLQVWVCRHRGASSTTLGTERALGVHSHAELRKPGGLWEAGCSL